MKNSGAKGLIYKSDTVNELSVHNFIFKHSNRHCPNIYKVLETASVSPSHRSLPPVLWTSSWLLFAPHHRRRNFFQRDVSVGEERSGNHNITTNSNNLFVNFRWTFTLALRNRMTERTSHLAGLWIGAAISNTSHSNKAGSTIVKRARLTVKYQGRRHYCNNKHINFPHRPTRVVSLLSLHTSYIYKCEYFRSHSLNIYQIEIYSE